MANITKARAATALQAAGIPRRSFSIKQFCARHDFSEGFYQKIRKVGLGPRETRILDRIIITDDAETDWLRDREAAGTAA